MSFSSKVKSELARNVSEDRNFCIAELLGMIHMAGTVMVHPQGKISLRLLTENAAVARKYFTLLKKTFSINAEIMMRKNKHLKKNQMYYVIVSEARGAKKILEAMGLRLEEIGNLIKDEVVFLEIMSTEFYKRAYLKGAFLGGGSVSDPEKNYHLEFVCDDLETAQRIQKTINTFELQAKMIHRKKNYVVYLKEGDQIVTLLNLIEAHIALLDFENVRIYKEVRNNVNRIVNCETANLNKTVSASLRQIENIEYIREHLGFEDLPHNLREMAAVRLEYPDASLKELGEMLYPPVGKSGVNHRLRKLDELAEKLKMQRGGI